MLNLHKLDLINKYLFTSIYDVPKIEKIITNFSILENDEYTTEEIDLDSQIKYALIFSYINETNPIINYKIKKFAKIFKENIYLKRIITNKKDMQKFLKVLYIDCNITFPSIKNDINTKNIIFKFPISKFKDVQKFPFINTKDNSIKNINFHINIVIKNSVINDLKNIYPFWLSN